MRHTARPITRVAFAALIIAVVPATAYAQRDGTRVAFDVASVKPNPNTQGRAVAFVPPSGSVLFTHHSVLDLINYAYGLKSSYELVGVPDWARREQFDIRATPGEGVNANSVPRMMQTLLAERFGLQAHRETKDVDVYRLVLARPAEPGATLTRATHDCAAFFATGATLGSPDVPLDENGRVACGTSVSIVPPSGLRISVLGVRMAEVAHAVETFGGLGRPIADGTGQTGTWNAVVTFSRGVSAATQAATELPLIETALREQLGLRVMPGREARSILVVDSVARPAAD